MRETLIGEQIRRANRNLLVMSVLLMAGVLALLALNTRYLLNAVQGPRSISRAELTSLTSPDVFRNWVTVRGEETKSTGVTQVMRRKSKYTGTVTSESTNAYYLATRVGNRVLLVKSPHESAATTFTGELQEVPEELASQLSVKPGSPVLPFMLNADRYPDLAYGMLVVAFPAFAFGLWNVARWRMHSVDPTGHPIARKLAEHGDLETVVNGMDHEFRTSHRRIGDILLTTSWMLKPTTFGLTALAMRDVIWVYKKVTQHKTNFIPTHKSFAVVIRSRSGLILEFSANDRQTDELLQQAQLQVPWAILGFDKQLEQQWLRDKNGFIAAVDVRREEYYQWARAQGQPAS